MPTTFVAGDLFSAPDLDALAHGCNCAGAMGKGIAVEFRRRFPQMYAEYRKRCQEKRFGLGDVFLWKGDAGTVFNLGTQEHWRRKADLEVVEQAVTQMISEAQAAGIHRIGLPRIEAGLGGLDWSEEVKPLLARLGATTPVDLVVFETFVRA